MVHVSPKNIRASPNATDGPLDGLAVAVKDNISTADMPTTCASAMLSEYTPPFDATVVQLLRTAGADIVGKTNCDEFGMGSMNTHTIHGPVVNPFSSTERRSAGGSSGGSAAAVASGMCDVALATDTGGSTRLPAAYCGIVGLKPSYGLISRWGVVSFADSLDCVGVMARDVAGVQRVFDKLNVYDARDPTAAPPPIRAQAVAIKTPWSEAQSLAGLRIGIPQEYFPSTLSAPSLLPTALASNHPLRHVLRSLQQRGAQLVSVSLPSTAYALSAYYVLASAEASSNLARFDGVQYGLHVDAEADADNRKTADVYARTRSQGFGREVRKRVLLGTYALTAGAFDNYFLQAQRVRACVKADFDRVFRDPNVLGPSSSAAAPADGVDVLLHPSAIGTAPVLDDAGGDGGDGLSAYVQDVLTVPASLAGLPALTVPAGLGEDGWPVGVSVVGQWGCDAGVLDVGRAVEEAVART
ncbi:hypothetical protein PLICRDRAFT_178347 [Plicaturopsis crispa FD-325 SS-3]|nr:hypothetical protein PLICRDRAFT_178347 [Plicaturopsis crispa FD-325 SS-3]